MFHLPALSRLPRVKRKGQLWVGWCNESEVNYPMLRDPVTLGRLDLMMTYRLASDVPAIYLPEGQVDWQLPPEEKKPEHLAAVLISSSNDRSRRIAYLKELMNHVEVHSYGKALNNRSMPLPDRGRSTKLGLLRSYKFTLAFENSICADYVTEKFFDPLVAGSVPVYLGAPNIEEFAPGDHCYINVANFPSPQRLAEYLLHLNNDHAAYAEYFAWKRKPLRPGFLRLVELASTPSGIRLCHKLQSVACSK